MVKILSHRGLWRLPVERNTPQALSLALAEGFGVETDVRDFSGRLVVSHDPPLGSVYELGDFLGTYSKLQVKPPLALNIKSDGLQQSLHDLLRAHEVHDYFVFDMSFPELIRYRAAQIPYFTRLSDHEPAPLAIQGSRGVWVDGFDKDWDDWERLSTLLEGGSSLALVSPELHHREKANYWDQLRNWLAGIKGMPNNDVFICTDYPKEARDFFL
jgi:glycerophosphoryl diester phosphodiesterase